MNTQAELTRCESKIAEMIAWGATKKEIAKLLFVSIRTVENHARNIYDKVGVTKANELSAWWFCTRFRISFDLSPLKRGVVTIFFLLVTLFAEFCTYDTAMYRPTNIRPSSPSLVRQCRRKNDSAL